MATTTINETFEKFSKTTLESVKELTAINTRLFEKVASAQRAFVTELLDFGTTAATGTKSVKDVEKFVTEYNEKVVAAARTATDILMASRDEYQSWFEKGVKAASDSTPEGFTIPAAFTIPGTKKAA